MRALIVAFYILSSIVGAKAQTESGPSQYTEIQLCESLSRMTNLIFSRYEKFESLNPSLVLDLSSMLIQGPALDHNPSLKSSVAGLLTILGNSQKEESAAHAQYDKVDSDDFNNGLRSREESQKVKELRLDNIVSAWKKKQEIFQAAANKQLGLIKAASSSAPISLSEKSASALTVGLAEMVKSETAATSQFQIEVTEVSQGGVLADIMKPKAIRSSLGSVGGGGNTGVYFTPSGLVAFFVGLSGAAEGERYDVQCDRDGNYQFSDGLGAARTVQKWKVMRYKRID